MVRFALSAAMIASGCLSEAKAQPQQIDIRAGTLPAALAELSRQTGVSVGLAGIIPAHPTPSIHGRMALESALRRLLKGSGLQAVPAGPNIWRLEPASAKRPALPRPLIIAKLDDIIVTARKRDEPLREVPISIAVLRPDFAQAMAAHRGVHDVLAFSEGVVTTNLGPGRDRIFLRGVADSAFNGSTQSTVNLFLDEARVSYATPDPDLRMVDIDRIEVLRGPQGTLYGSGALGGIVRIVPNKPDLRDWTGMAAMEATKVAHGGFGGVGEAVINAPILSDQLAVRIAAYADQGGGWIDDAERDRQNVNRSRRFGTRAALGWRFADAWRADFGLTAQWLNVRDSQYAFRRLERSTTLAEPHDNDFLAATATLQGKVGALDVTSVTAYVTHEFSSIFDATSQAGLLGHTAPIAFKDLRQLRLVTQEVRLSDPVATRPWVVGANLLQAENTLRDSFLPDGSSAVEVTLQHNDSLEVALFGEATQKFGAKWSATIGVRAYLARVDNEQSGQARHHASKSGLTPSFNLSWHPDEHVMLWVRYASAVRPGGINPNGDPQSRSFRSDDLKSMEFGWRIASANNKIRLNGSLFGLRWENVQSDILGTDNLIRTINAGTARNIGAELSAMFRIQPFTLETNLTLQHGRLYRPASAANALGDDNRLPVLPDYAGGLKLSYARMLADLPFHAFMSVRYTGPARLSFDPSLGRPMGDFWVGDVGADISKGNWKVGITVANLLDQRENSFGFGNPFTIRSIDQRTPFQPRTLSLRVETHF